MLKALDMKDLGGGRRTKTLVVCEAKWTYPSCYKNGCDKEMCPLFSLSVESLILMLLCDALDLCLIVGGS